MMWGQALIDLVAAIAEPFYIGATAARNCAYDRRLRAEHRAHVPVISVGNLTTGGTGKTPMVIDIVRRLRDQGHRPAVILRGYRASAAAGSDEQREMEASLPEVAIIANPDRVAAAAVLRRDQPGVDVIVLDDGFQHRRIARDLDLVLIDATNPFGGEHVLPRGRMRERAGNLRRADAVVVTRCDRVGAEELAAIDRRIERHHGRPPIAHAAHVWSRIVDGDDATIDRPHAHVFAFAGIGNPGAFFAQAGERFRLVGTAAYPDHADYGADDIAAVVRGAIDTGADALLTTPKDWVKLRPLLESAPAALPIWRPLVEMRFLDGEGELARLIAEAARRPA